VPKVGPSRLAASSAWCSWSCWLRTRDVHRPNHHFGMRGGWSGFWITTVLFSGLLVVGIVLLLAEWRTRRRVAR
jgi:uncharacterized membrane protein